MKPRYDNFTMSKKEILEYTNKIFWDGWDTFISNLQDRELFGLIDKINNAALPEIIWVDDLPIDCCAKIIERSNSYNKSIKSNYEIRMNMYFLYYDNAKNFIRETLLHELAHYFCDVMFGDFEHDKTFKTACQILCEDIDISGDGNY